MNTGELVSRLEHVTPVNMELASHREQLKLALCGMNSQPRTVGISGWKFLHWLPARQPVWKTVLIASSAWLLVIAAVIYAILPPVSGSGMSIAMAADLALNSPQIKAILPADGTATVTATDIGNHIVAIVIQKQGVLINAQVDAAGALRILKITRYMMLAPPLEGYVVTPEYRQKILTLAGADARIKTLLDGGAAVRRIQPAVYNVVTNDLDTGTVTNVTEHLTLLVLTAGTGQPEFLVNPDTGLVISLSDSN
jgi:hypothetical protein